MLPDARLRAGFSFPGRHERHEERPESRGNRRDRGPDPESEAIYAADYRGLTVSQAAALRARLREADASFRIVKNTLTLRAADKAGAEQVKELIEGPTAFTFVQGDPALAAKALDTFARQENVLELRGGLLGEQLLTPMRSGSSRGSRPASSSTPSSPAWWPRRSPVWCGARRRCCPASRSRWARSRSRSRPRHRPSRRRPQRRSPRPRGASRRGGGAGGAGGGQPPQRRAGAAGRGSKPEPRARRARRRGRGAAGGSEDQQTTEAENEKEAE